MTYTKNFYQIKSNQEIFDAIKKEKESVGYYDLPYQDTTEIKTYASTIHKKHIVIIGIGGSSLGARAIYEFLVPSNNYTQSLHFLETTDPLEINHTLNSINLNHSHFVIISKSGTTIETISIFKYIASLIKIDARNSTVISEKESQLAHYANSNHIKLFTLDHNIGGRFSVFSVVGLVPLAMIGIDIDNLLNGCKKVHESFFSQTEYYGPIIEKARFLVENKNRFNINVLFSYSSSLESFNKWYIQLWGESLGKLNINGTRQALTPIGLVGPVDQHSFLQLIIDGKRDKTVTFIKIENLKCNIRIPQKSLTHFDALDYIDGLKFSDLITQQANATIKSIETEKDIPCDTITITTVDEYNIAKLMYMYQLLTSCVGRFVQINTYDQPGVESGKIILKNTLQEEN